MSLILYRFSGTIIELDYTLYGGIMDQGNARIPHAGKQPGHEGVLDVKKFGKYFLLAAFLLSLIAFINVIKIFLVEIVVAAVVTTLFYPLYRKILVLCRGHRGVSALVSCLIILICLLIPLLIISNIVI